jgi:hypothetical protein
MESSSNLPRLPSERKAKAAEKEKPSTSNVQSSPTQICNLQVKASDSGSVTDEPNAKFLNPATPSPLVPNLEQQRQDRHTRDEQLDLFESLEPLPPSSTAEKLLRFMNTTTQFINSLEVEVSEKLDSCSNKILTLDHKVSLIESRRPRLEPPLEKQS